MREENRSVGIAVKDVVIVAGGLGFHFAWSNRTQFLQSCVGQALSRRDGPRNLLLGVTPGVC